MEAGFVLLVIFMTLVGIVIGVFIGKAKRRHDEIDGILVVDYDSDGEPYPYLNPKVSISDIISRKRVVFNVKHIRQYSQK